jgi:hypothetical protein
MQARHREEVLREMTKVYRERERRERERDRKSALGEMTTNGIQ